MATRTVTVDEVIAAAEKNGYIHCRGGWMKDENGSPTFNSRGTSEQPIVQACILGQIAINLSVDYYDLENGLNELGMVENNPWLDRQAIKLGYDSKDDIAWTYGTAAIQYNDGSKLSYNAIAKKVVSWLKPHRGDSFQAAEVKYVAIRKAGK